MLTRLSRSLVVIAVPILVLALPKREPSLSTRVERFFSPLVASRDFSGVVLVSRGDTVLVRQAYGMADFELGVPVTTGTRFRIASITKTFTGAAVAMLAEGGKLSLQDSLSKFLPDFPNGEKIQIRHLLLHESGVGNPDSEPCDAVTLEELVAQIAAKPLAFSPGTNSRYSNGGYALLARVIEKATGRRWEEFLREEIFRPLSLTATCVDDPEPLLPKRARGFAPGPREHDLINAPCSSAQGAIGSGALISTADDLMRWARAVRNERLFRRSALEHPYGWGVRSYDGRRAIEQSGIVKGAISYLAVYLDDDVTVVVLSNVQSGLGEQIGKAVGRLAFGLDPPRIDPSPAGQFSTARERYGWLGQYRNANIGSFRLVDRNDALYQVWGDSRQGSYVRSTGPDSGFNAQDSAQMQAARDPAGSVTSIRISFGGSPPQAFDRQ